MKKYKSYKKSNLFSVSEIPDHWITLRMKNIGNLYGGLSGKKGDDFGKENSVFNKYYVPFKNIANNNVINPEVLDKVEIFENESQNEVLKGDLLFLMSSENYEDIGKTALVKFLPKSTYLNSFCKGFRVDNSEINSTFLNYLLQADEFRKSLSIEAKGFTRINLQIGKITNLGVCAPKYIEEQKKIANYLDHKTAIIDALIEKKEQLIKKLQAQRQAIINESVTKGLNPNAKMKNSGIEWLGEIPEHWEAKRLKFIFNIQKRIAGVLGYDILSVTQRGLKVKDISNYKGQFSMNYSKYQIVYEGDFVMNHMDLLTGYIDISKQTGVTSPDYRVFELIDKECNSAYFLYLCQLCYKEKIFYSHGQGVSQLGRWRLQAKEFNNMTFPFPSFEEQTEIADYIDLNTENMDKVILESQVSIKKLKSYRQSIISEAVTGKIDVRDWQAPTKN